MGRADLGDRAGLEGRADPAAPVDRERPAARDRIRNLVGLRPATLGPAEWLDGGTRELYPPPGRYTG